MSLTEKTREITRPLGTSGTLTSSELSKRLGMRPLISQACLIENVFGLALSVFGVIAPEKSLRSDLFLFLFSFWLTLCPGSVFEFRRGLKLPLLDTSCR